MKLLSRHLVISLKAIVSVPVAQQVWPFLGAKNTKASNGIICPWGDLKLAFFPLLMIKSQRGFEYESILK